MLTRDKRDDAVALESLQAREGAGKKNHGSLAGRFASLKALFAVFVLFVFVVSDVFTNHVVASFGGAVRGRNPTPYGVAVQGIFLVVFYVLALYLVEGGVL